MADNIDFWPPEQPMQYDPTYFGGLMAALLGDVERGGSVLDKRRKDYMAGYGTGSDIRAASDVGLAALPFAPGAARIAGQAINDAMIYGTGPMRGMVPEVLTAGPKVGKLQPIEILFPNRTAQSLSPAEKSALTRYEKSLSNPAVMRRERIAVEGGGDIVNPTPGEVFVKPGGIVPTALKDKYVVPVMTDWSGGGETIKQVAGVPLSREVKKQGGITYGTLQPNVNEGVAWASMPTAAQNKINNLNKFSDRGETIGVSSNLGPESSNFSHHIAQGLIGQLDTLRPSKEAMTQFRTAVRNTPVIDPVTKEKSFPFKKFPGVDSPNIWDIMQEGVPGQYSAGDIRKVIAQTMSKAQFRDLGFPKWQTITDLVNIPGSTTGATGGLMFKAKPGGQILTPSYQHGSYTAGIPTEGLLGTGFLNAKGQAVTVPDSLVFRKTFERLRNAGKTDSNIRTSLLKSHHGEQVDDQTIEGLMKYLGY